MVRRMRLQAVAALGTGGVVHHVLRDQVVEAGVVARLLPPEHLLDDFLRVGHRRSVGRGPVGELLDVAVERPALDQLQVEVGGTAEDRVRPGRPVITG